MEEIYKHNYLGGIIMKKLIFGMVGIALALLLTACGGNDGGTEASGDAKSGNSVDIVASNWQFDQETYTVPAGDVTFNLTNEEGFHSIIVEGADVKIDGEGSATASLEAGEYTIRCNVPCGEGHSEMTSTLVVE